MFKRLRMLWARWKWWRDMPMRVHYQSGRQGKENWHIATDRWFKREPPK